LVLNRSDDVPSIDSVASSKACLDLDVTIYGIEDSATSKIILDPHPRFGSRSVCVIAANCAGAYGIDICIGRASVRTAKIRP
jgi:hypothetical protein